MLSPDDCEMIQRETFIEAFDVFDELPSTNDHAISRCADPDTIKPLLVIARRQQAGRGRGANQWWASAGALTFSVLLGPEHVSPTGKPSPMTSLAVGVAVCNAVAAIDPTLAVGLKWPNDVFVEGRKLAGILIECSSQLTGDVVIGVGVNVNNSLRDAPSELTDLATSLTDLLYRDLDVAQVLLLILQQFENQLTNLHADPRRLAQRCSQLCVLEGKYVSLLMGERRIEGICRGIGESGALLIQTRTATVECIAGHVESFKA